MGRITSFYGTTIGKKAVVAVTGLVLFLFLILHMLGNLESFQGVDAAGTPELDVYARFLRTVGAPLFSYGQLLWVVRIVLGSALVLHVVTIVMLARRNRAARPHRYQHRRYVQASRPARWMLGTGLLLLAFLIFHLLQFTTGTIGASRFHEGRVYENVFLTFKLWPYVLLYVAAVAVVGLHLYHGVWSLFQTLGIDNPDRNRGLRRLALIAALAIFLGFASVPTFFFAGAMSPPPAAPAQLATSASGAQ